jgi:hypothetical protein
MLQISSTASLCTYSPSSASPQSTRFLSNFLYPRSNQPTTSCLFKCHRYQPPCHHSNLYLRRIRHCHPHPHDHIWQCGQCAYYPWAQKESIRISLVDLRTLWQLPICLQTPRLVRTVLEYDVSLLVLVVSKREQYYIALVDPDFLSELPTDMGEALLAVEAERFEAAVAEHLEDLGIFLAFFFEGQLALLVVVFVLATTPVFTSLVRTSQYIT